ncbi:MAG TPA: LytTR family DNA-binding domain-containing protein [Balneolaceae bacterium]|nr:LytTR family DNA-binding domain-containing protein [Balneolaceae bacterium]
MKLLIIEDEMLAADRLEDMLLKIDPDIIITDKLQSVQESVRWLSNNSVDLILLDIQLSDGSAFSIFDKVDVTTPIIFTTAYDQYAIKAFELNSIGYLLKPVRADELENSLEKFRSMESAFTVNIKQLLASYLNERQPYKNRFLIRIGDVYKQVETKDIAYFYAMEKSVFFKTLDGRTLPIEYSLDALEDLLNPDSFFRINRGYLINISSIKSMEAWSRGRIKLELEPEVKHDRDTIVSVGRSAGFKQWLDQ